MIEETFSCVPCAMRKYIQKKVLYSQSCYLKPFLTFVSAIIYDSIQIIQLRYRRSWIFLWHRKNLSHKHYTKTSQMYQEFAMTKLQHQGRTRNFGHSNERTLSYIDCKQAICTQISRKLIKIKYHCETQSR